MAKAKAKNNINLVVGGSGFLGEEIVRQLVARGEKVRVLDLTKGNISEAEYIIGDMSHSETVQAALENVLTVYQTASIIEWRPTRIPLMKKINIEANRMILQVAAKSGIKEFIYSSSIDVVFDGKPIREGTESLPYPKKHLDYYSSSKAEAEKEVLAANGKDGMATCSIRPAGIWGPGDKHRIGTILKEAEKGSIFKIGNGKAIFNHVYVENCAHAHLLASDNLKETASAAGNAYFITDYPASNFFDFTTHIIREMGSEAKEKRIPFALAIIAAWFSEIVSKIPFIKSTPLLTRYVVYSTCRDFYFSSQKAERELNYSPIISYEEAVKKTANWLKNS